jgi:hypothetical protein
MMLLAAPGGAELLVLEGSFADDEDRFEPQSSLRLPPGIRVIIESADKKPASFPSAVDLLSPDDTTEAEHLDELLDEALIETFPANDPVAITIERAIRNRHNSPPTVLSTRVGSR